MHLFFLVWVVCELGEQPKAIDADKDESDECQETAKSRIELVTTSVVHADSVAIYIYLIQDSSEHNFVLFFTSFVQKFILNTLDFKNIK